jgi:hypothetical protein
MPDMDAASKESLLTEIREAEGRQTNVTPLAELMRRWLNAKTLNTQPTPSRGRCRFKAAEIPS